MAFRWACTTCGELHESNPTRCRNCGGSASTPASKRRVRQHSYERGQTRAIDPDDLLTVGTEPDPDLASSRDVRPDGSVAEASASRVGSSDGSIRRGAFPIEIVPWVLFGLVVVVAMVYYL